MADKFAGPEISFRSAGVQVGAAVVVVSAVLSVGWSMGAFGASPEGSSGGEVFPRTAATAAACTAPKAEDSPGYPALCAALNRPDLPTLLGMPGERVSVAEPGGGPVTHADGTKTVTPSAEVQIGAVNIRVDDNQEFPVEDFKVFEGMTPTSLLGHPAAVYSDRTIAIAFSLGGGQSTSGPGGIARHLAVAKGTKPTDGTFELTIWRQDSLTPDDAALTRIAAQVFPTLQGWTTAS